MSLTYISSGSYGCFQYLQSHTVSSAERVVLVKLGFFTACLAQSDLVSIAQRAAQAGFSVLEAAAWPSMSRDHTAAHIDVRALGPAEAEAIRAVLARHD